MRRIIFCLLVATTLSAEQYYLSVVAIFQNEARFLKEWVEFHRIVGVEHFYLFNNLSDDNYLEVLEPYIEEGIVELYDWPYFHSGIVKWNDIQCSTYRKILEEKKDETKWLAIIDTDEFLFPLKHKSLKDFLVGYEKYGGVGVNWQHFGTSFVDKVSSDELLIEKLTMSAERNFGRNKIVKSIVQPKKVRTCNNPHYCVYRSHFYSVSENKEKYSGCYGPSISVEKIRLNHYWGRDEDFFYNNKIPRVQKMYPNNSTRLIEKQNSLMNKVRDKTIHRYVPELNQALFTAP